MGGNQTMNKYHELLKEVDSDKSHLAWNLIDWNWVNCFPPESPLLNWKVASQNVFQKEAKFKLVCNYQQFAYHFSYEQVLY